MMVAHIWRYAMSDNPGTTEHVTNFDADSNTRTSYDVTDSGIGGVGSNWVSISDPHFTNQNEPKGSPKRHTGYQQKSHDIYADD